MSHVFITLVLVFAFLCLDVVASSPLQNDDRHLKSRIIGGTIANAQRYPYYTYLLIYFASGSIASCGGSLVNPDVVLTAAHCIEEDPLDPTVRITAIVNYTQSVRVTGFLTGYEHIRLGTSGSIHGNYDTSRLVNDIGLIYLNSPVNEVTPVNLNDNGNLPADGDPVTVFGHGRISNAEPPEFPYYLMEVSVPIVPFQDCNDQNSYWGGIVDQSMICAGASSGGKGTCIGDSGGPLIILGSSATQDVQVGIVSFGSSEGCSIVNYPSVFTRVSNYRQWIQGLICLYSNVKPQSCSNVAQPTSKPVVTNPPTPMPTREPINPPTPTPTREPTNKPVVTNPPTPTPTREPTNPPTLTPSNEPTNKPVVTNPPTPTPTSEPTNPPTSTPSREPTNKPVVTNPPTPTPTPEPTNPPTPIPTSEPTSMPVVTKPPTPTPTNEPTNMPVITNPPTPTPTSEPTNIPAVTNPLTTTPTSEPTNQPAVTNPPTPTKKPVITKAPTRKPRPTFRPTPAPSGRTKAPTRNPTVKKKKITPRPSPSPSKASLSRKL